MEAELYLCGVVDNAPSDAMKAFKSLFFGILLPKYANCHKLHKTKRKTDINFYHSDRIKVIYIFIISKR